MSSELSEQDKKTLLKIARDTIESYTRSGEKPALPDPLPDSLSGENGAFVTIHKKGSLRGCIGNFVGQGPLAATVQNMALAAGWEDPRFPPLAESELKDIDIEISVLSPLREINSVDDIEVGKHGIYITKGMYRGVLLPQVAVEQGWDRDTFLSQTCVKAGLPPDAWKNRELKIEIFSADVFGEEELKK
ncbi:MAG: AmmeMemoRadiSam system protein A [bacterium]